MNLDLERLLFSRPADPASHGRLTLGQVIDGWRIEAYLGAGRSSEVYRVLGTRLGGEGALKLLIDDTQGLRARFERETDVLRTLACPALPRFFGCGVLDGRPYYVMEYLQPLFLPLDRSEVVPFVHALARSVGELHAAGYVHRDLKPANLLRRRNGEPVLIDLGLVRRIGERGEQGVGTLGFAAPEQLLRGEATVRADVFALGKILRAAGGRALGRRLRAVVRRATHEDPEERYASAAAFAAAVRGARRTHLAFAAGGTALALAALAGGVVALCRLGTVPAPAAVASVQAAPEDAAARDRLVAQAEDLFHGRTGETNRAAAVRLYRQAAEAGHPGAQDSLGLCLLRGWDCEADEAEAVCWFTAAAKQEHPSAMNNLAFCYMNGKGVTRDLHKGFVWANLAAAKGHAPSQTLVGECYLYGWGVAADPDQAAVWLSLAAQKGNRRARQLLDGDVLRQTGGDGNR